MKKKRGRPAKLSQAEVDEIWLFWRNSKMKQSQIARMMKVSETLIAKVLDKKYTPND